MKNKLLSIILIAIMVLTIIPSLTFASNDDPFAEDVFGDPITTTVTTKPSDIASTTPSQMSSASQTTATVEPTNAQKPTSTQTTIPSETKTNSVDPTNPDDTSKTNSTSVSTNPTVSSTDSTSNSIDSNNDPTIHTHKFTARITKTPSCTEEGIKSFSCKCGYSYTESVLKTNHKTMFKVVNSTYFKQGTKSKICTFCGLKISQVSLKKKVVSKSFFTLAKGKKQFKINYKRVGKSIGFQVRYRIKGKWKTKTFNSKKSITKTIKKLKKGTYTVQIRAFRKSSGKIVYSRWSSSRKVKVTK